MNHPFKSLSAGLLVTFLVGQASPVVAQQMRWQPYEQRGFLETQRQQYSTVELVLTSRLQLINSESKPNDKAILSYLEKLITVCESQHKLAEAEQYCNLALEFCKRLPAPGVAAEPDKQSTPLICGFKASLARIYGKQAKYNESIAAFKESLRLYQQSGKLETREAASVMTGLAAVLTEIANFPDAEALFAKAAAIRAKNSLAAKNPGLYEPESNLSPPPDLTGLAYLYVRQSKWKEAEAALQKAIQIDETELGNDQPALAANLNNLAYVYYKQGKFATAEPLLRRAVQIAKAWKYADQADWMESLAAVYVATNNKAAAADLLAKANAARTKQPGNNLSRTITTTDPVKPLNQ
jgi:tetratricopeptide (TPR) repeat protein